MASYLGKQRLTRILYNYLENSAPEKLSELKRELKSDGEYRKYKIRYKKHQNSEWLNTSIYFGDIEYRFEIYAWSLSVDNLTFNSAYVGTSSNKGIFGDITYTPCIYFFYNADFTYKTSSRGSENTANGIIAVKMNNPKISNDGKITYEEISVVSSSTDVDDYKSAIESFEKLF